MPTLDLTTLSRLLAADRARRRGTVPTWAALGEASGRELQRVRRWLESSRPETYGLFGSEDELLVAIVDAFEPERVPPADLKTLAAVLARDAAQQWLVAAPLINVMPPDAPETLAPEMVFIAAPHGARPDLRETREALRGLLGAELDPGRRHQHDADGALVDTRHTASLVMAETGTRRACETRALCKAQYALAVWTLLEPPQNDVYMPLWPVATTWLPQPFIHIDPAARPRDPHARQARGATILYAPDENALYRPPAGEARTAPLRALNAIARRPATALISAAWSLYVAARLPTDLQWLDRLELVMRAREALCEPPHGDAGTDESFRRWQAVSSQLGVARELRRRGFGPRDVRSVTSRAWQLRNLSAHSAEAALLAVGYPPGRSRPVRDGLPIPGAELAPLHIRDAVEPCFAAGPDPDADRDPLPGDGQPDHDLRQVGAVILEVGVTLHHVRRRLPAVVWVVDAEHPLAGRALRARRVYRRYGRRWLVLELPDGGVISVEVEDTDVLEAEPVVRAAVEGSTLSRVGARRLLGLLAACMARCATDSGEGRA